MDLRDKNGQIKKHASMERAIQKKDELLKKYPGADVRDNVTRKITTYEQEEEIND